MRDKMKRRRAVKDICPITIIKDRYNGVYAGGKTSTSGPVPAKFTAWNLHCDKVPEEINGGDPECANFWWDYQGIVGKGDTPNEALEDLERQHEI